MPKRRLHFGAKSRSGIAYRALAGFPPWGGRAYSFRGVESCSRAKLGWPARLGQVWLAACERLIEAVLPREAALFV